MSWRADVDFDQASAINAAAKIEEPVLLIHSQMDSQTASQQSVNISEQLNEKSTFYHLDWGGDHTQDVLINKDKFQALINEFIGNVNASFLNTERKEVKEMMAD